MDLITQLYGAHHDLLNIIMAVLVFGGLGRISFWNRDSGLEIGGMLATGLALLLTIALLTWAKETGRRIQDLGPWAAFILIEAILILALNARKKSREN